VRRRLIVAFIVVALLAALATAWLASVILPFFPSLHGFLPPPKPFVLQFITALHQHPAGIFRPARLAAFALFLAPAVLLLGVIIGLAFAAARPVLRPVRRLAQAAEQMSGGDLTVRVQPQGRDELARLVISFNEMATALEDKVAALQHMEERARQFAGDVSHELRTPLTAMTAVTDILGGNAGLTGDAAAAARLVRDEILHLNRLVDDLIEISRFDAGTARLVIDETDIAAAVSGCLRARAWEDVQAAVPAGLVVGLDRRRFDVILANLVGNALRHGGLPVTVTAGLEPDGEGAARLKVTVRDGGPGLPPAAIPHVFDRFYKADSARARSEGSGLGLAIAFQNARLHGGHIEAGNHPAGGAIFTVTLPVHTGLAVHTGPLMNAGLPVRTRIAEPAVR
jgi:two-component system, OmpR family, sensor histidine kinase MtrB